MNLSETTRRVLRLVEDRSGIPVHVEPDPKLPGTLLARIDMARGPLRLHRVFYRPDPASPPDYLICHQAGIILRFFQCPPNKRFDFAASPEADKTIERLVKDLPLARTLPPLALPQLCQMLRDGVLGHLRSIPVGMRVDTWLANDFPELADLQTQSILRQLLESAATLAPQYRQTAPAKIYDPSQAISAAFAAFWAERLNQPQLALPYKAAGYLQAGLELLETWRTTPDTAENDSTLVDRWAQKLGLAGWHQWVPYVAPQ